MFGVETVILSKPSLVPFPVCEYSTTPELPLINNGGRPTIMSGSKSQVVAPEVAHTQVVALVVVH
jgi:hypothetical protein